MNPETIVAYLGHNAQDAAVKRRIAQLRNAGARVRGYTMRREDDAPREWDNVDLGRTYDGEMRQRLASVAAATNVLRRHGPDLREADLWIARNLDMLLVAVLVRRFVGASAPLIYECLDIHPLMTREGPVGRMMRALERRLLRDTSAVIVSSPGFVNEYFDVHHPGYGPIEIIENRLPEAMLVDPRPSPGEPQAESEPIVVGWFGNMHCDRSLRILHGLAQRLPERVQVVLSGIPSYASMPEFDRLVTDLPNLSYRGRYQYPDDLARLYGSLDVIWAGDFFDARFNSRMLLPNRVYEGGYFGVPPIAPRDSETGRWITRCSAGWLLEEPIEDTIVALLERLTHAEIHARRCELLSRDRANFVAPDTEIADFLARMLDRDKRS